MRCRARAPHAPVEVVAGTLAIGLRSPWGCHGCQGGHARTMPSAAAPPAPPPPYGFVVCSSERSTNKISWHLTPRVLVPVVSPPSPTSGSTRTWRGSRRRTICSACTRYGGERGQQSNGDALAKYQPQGLCERHRRCPTKVLIAASRHACALRAVPRPWPDGSHLHFTLSVYLSRLCCADRT